MRATDLRTKLKIMAGLLLSTAMPSRTKEIRRAFTAPYWDPLRGGRGFGGFSGRMIRLYLAYRDNASGCGRELEEIHRGFWQSGVDARWYEAQSRLFERSALPRLKPIVAKFCDLLRDARIDTVCEIGTGNGSFIAYLRETLRQPQRFIGLDLSAERMGLNRKLYEKIDFVACDAVQWITQNSTNNTLYVTNGGVLEYVRQQSLETVLEHIAETQDGSAIALFHEPLVPDHDLERDLQSRLTRMGEFSFSHNYPHLLRKAGFTIPYLQDDVTAGYRALTLLAQSPSRATRNDPSWDGKAR